MNRYFAILKCMKGKVGIMIEEMSGKLGEKIFIKRFSLLEIGT